MKIDRNEERILLLAPTGRDSEIAGQILRNAGLLVEPCQDFSDLVLKMEGGCGAIVMAEETLGSSSVGTLTSLLSRQPSWSELPICIITSGGDASAETLRRMTFFNLIGNVTILERPFRPGTFVNALKVAMRSRLRQYQVRDLLRERDALAHRFQLMAEAMPQKIFTTDREGVVNYFNRQWLEFVGLSFEDAKARGWLAFVHPDDIRQTVARWERAAKSEGDFEMEHRLLGKDGIYRWHLSRGCPVRDETGGLLMFIGSNTDIDVQKQTEAVLENLVAERTRSLTETNKQLEAFCYTISHDLRAPLRAQRSFALALLEEFGGSLGDEGRAYATRINNAAARLEQLVADLLAYSRVSREELPLKAVELHAVVESIRDEMAFEINAARATVKIEDFDLRVLAHEPTLRMVLINLISNALKFSRKGIPAEISIAGARSCDKVTISISDNGIGIAAEHYAQIFGVFNRLHKAGEYPGTGVGLAIVQKAIERLGGRGGVESHEGIGSRFWIELQAAENAQDILK